MKFVMIIGPQAVGKMAVGLELAEKAGFGLFHNHHSIELAKEIYGDFSSEAKALSGKIRETVFDFTATSQLKGFIFTFVWAFNHEEDHLYVNNLINLYESHGNEVFLVELEADLETRVIRNKTPLRLEKKASKRNLDWSENELIKSLDVYRLNSIEGEVKHKNYLKINNNDLSAVDVANQIIQYFKF